MGEGRLNHIEIAQKFDLLDFANASKLTGSKFVFMKNEAAMLELALVNWAL
jgi:seryl-tRNA synthetase